MNINSNYTFSHMGAVSPGHGYKSPAMEQAEKAENGESKGLSMRQILSQNRQQQKNQGVVNQSIGYANQIREARTKAKDTALEKKKLQYDFKGISSQILRSKTSTNARQVVGKAKREVLRLKQKRQNPDIDQDELQAAIAHAQVMERAAKKKLRHLQEEEMVKITDNPTAGGMSEEELKDRIQSVDEESEASKESTQENPQDELLGEKTSEELLQGDAEFMQAQREAMQQMFQDMVSEIAENVSEELAESMAEEMSEMMERMWDSMDEMMEEATMSDLAETMFAPDPEMDAEEFKLFKIKHRSEEMKLITRADADYLKAVFEHYNKTKGLNPAISSNGNSAGAFTGNGGASMPQIAMPQMAIPQVSAPTMSIDISV